ncbi:ABC transporter substrate-binding protein [Bradyrhizobium sp. STM 3561]|uniref:CmpA/NrtA family ABC transporter substrate-binding protein n=1 Tax=Bradyrhizobium sp. STM 3561 TaxID=578923 RepID=UPI00389038A4
MTKRIRRPSETGLSRRQLLKAAGSTAALLAAAKFNFPAGAFAQDAGPEVKGAKLGFIALSDAGPLFVAKDKGLFAKYGMPDVDVQKQASWGTTRDNLVLGSEGNGIDGAHILTPMPYLISAGKVTQNNQPTPMYILARLNLDAQCISVAKEYADLKLGTDAAPFKAALEKKKASGKAVKAAMTFPGGTHDLWIRYWLAAGGIDPDKDIETIVVPPPQMVANMKVGTMDCFCVGEPWNLQLVHQDIGYTAVNTGEIWNKHPEKSFGMRAAFVDKYPKATKAILMAVLEAQQWADKAENKQELATIMAKRQWINCPVEDVYDRTAGKFDYGNGKVVENSPHIMKYWRDHASYPFQSHDLWFLTEDIRWGKYEANFDTKALIAKVNREDMWRDAAKTLGVGAADIPTSTSRGKETFFDGKVFDPENPAAYLKSLAIKRVEV